MFGSIKNKRSGVAASDYFFLQRFRNVFFEVTNNEVLRTTDVVCVSRPALQRISASAISSGNAQGVYYWQQTQYVYAVVNGDLYKSDTAGAFDTGSSFSVLGSLSGSNTAGCWFEEFFDGTNYYLMVKCEDGSMDRVSTADAITAISDSGFTGLTAVGHVASMDGFLFAVSAAGVVGHSALNDVTSFPVLNRITAGEYPDKGVSVFRHGSLIVVFGENSTEFFRNTGNASGSVLSRIQELSRKIGCTSMKSIVRHGDDIYFMGRTPETGVSIYRLRGTQIENISTAAIDRYLLIGSAAGRGTILPMEGHVFYCVSLGQSPTSQNVYGPVLDITTGFWVMWDTLYDSTWIQPLFAGGEGNQATYFQTFLSNVPVVIVQAPPLFFGVSAANTNYAIYKPTTPVYSESGGGPFYEAMTDEVNFGTNKKKIMHSLMLQATKNSSNVAVTVSTCDNGTRSFTQKGVIDTSVDSMRLSRLGMFRKRQILFQWTAGLNTIRAAECDIAECAH